MSILISHLWLEQYLQQPLEAKALPEMLTNAGLEVEDINYGQGLSEYFIIGQITAVSAHPNAKKLNCCKVDIGSECLDIVCGCPSVRAGAYVVVAKVGAVLPSGLAIKSAEIRGEMSNGMLCSAAELGLVAKSEGIILIEEQCQLGMLASELLKSDDVIYNISLTPDRGDCFSIRGIAREAFALQYDQLMPLKNPNITKLDSEKFADVTQFVLLAANFANKSTPLAWQLRLLTSGYLVQNYLVDFTQYYMHELGQPMHVYDADKLDGMPYVRYAKDKETIIILGGKEIVLDSDILVVADNTGPVAIAGVIGGERTAVTITTKNVVLELANFASEVIARATQKLNIHTAASDRFTRGVDPLCLHLALDIAKQHFTDYKLTGYSVCPELTVVELSYVELKRVLGEHLSTDSLINPLLDRGFEVSMSEQFATIKIPSHRTDITNSIEVIEEILRIQGHQQWPASELIDVMSIADKPNKSPVISRLVAHGFNEMITYSFIDPSWLYGLQVPQLANPMSKDMSVMRPSILYGLADRLSYNIKRQLTGARVFETGKIFKNNIEQDVIAGIVFGAAGSNWVNKTPDDFYYLKGLLEPVLLQAEFVTSEVPPIWYHPHACAQININDQLIGHIGLLHPKFQAMFGLEQAVGFEILSDLPQQEISKFVALSKFPVSRKDLSFLVGSKVQYQDIKHVISKLDIDILQGFELFDVYNESSYSISLWFQSADATLSDKEILAQVAVIVSALESQLDLKLRGEL